MTIGFVFECGPQGADKQVCEYLAAQLRPDERLISRTMDNKPSLLADAAAVAKALLDDDGCDLVLIVWDLRPAWPVKGKKPCRFEERRTVLAALARQGLADRPVFLVCIEQELESWLLADHDKLSSFLSTPQHAYQVQRIRHPDRVPNPKAVMMNHFEQARGWRYEDRVNAIKVMKSGEPNLSLLRRSMSFCRFEAKLTGPILSVAN